MWQLWFRLRLWLRRWSWKYSRCLPRGGFPREDMLGLRGFSWFLRHLVIHILRRIWVGNRRCDQRRFFRHVVRLRWKIRCLGRRVDRRWRAAQVSNIECTANKDGCLPCWIPPRLWSRESSLLYRRCWCEVFLLYLLDTFGLVSHWRLYWKGDYVFRMNLGRGRSN